MGRTASRLVMGDGSNKAAGSDGGGGLSIVECGYWVANLVKKKRVAPT